ncbi:hypothetical protein V6R21_02580 [Limibacter armeniacum]|uniref:hypothetical protein n=1 Tax=Limibacter armeniacum TaxID=466084 RepID=UPI002FE67B9F
MQKTLLFNRNVINFGIPLVLLVVLIFTMKSSFIAGNDTLYLAVTADLILTIPFVYLLLIFKTGIPKTTIVPVIVVGLLIGSYFLPKEGQMYLGLFKSWALPIIELAVLTVVVIKFRKALKAYRGLKDTVPDFFDILRSSCHDILPKNLVLPFATEVAVFYYGFVNWKEKIITDNEFTYHKKSGTPALFGAFILIISIETIALHFLLLRWNTLIAWVQTGLSLYTVIQLFGFAKALSKRPISMDDKNLILRYGIMNEAQIPYLDIETVYLSKKGLGKDQLFKTLSPLGELESHNVIIRLKRAHTLTGLYGFKKKFKTIGFHLDEPNDFKEKLDNIIQQDQ